MSLNVWAVLTLAGWAWGYYVYNRGIAAGGTRPRIAYWFTMFVVDWVLLVALLAAGQRGLKLEQAAIWAAGATATLLHAYRRDRRLHFLPNETICLLLVSVGLILWNGTRSPQAAIVILLTATAVAQYPFWRNAWLGHERWQPMIVYLCASGASLGTVPFGFIWNWPRAEWTSFIAPLVGLLFNLMAVSCALRGKWHARSPAP